MKAIVYQHAALEGPGALEPALREAGFEVVIRQRQVAEEDLQANLVVALGGPMAVYQASRHPFILEELSVFRARLVRGAPCLGICLGAQILAAAAGARVFEGNAGLELGVEPVEVTDDGRRDPVFVQVPAQFDVSHWHQDTFGEVPNATLLASTPRYAQQAFRVGNSYGLQFHPELTSDLFRSWLQASPEDSATAYPDLDSEARGLARLDAAQPVLRTLLRGLAAQFADFKTSRAITSR